jgi:alanine-synthesizing transaminase
MSVLSSRSRYAGNPIEEEDRVADRLAMQGKKIIKLNRGDPAVYFRTPEYIINAYKQALEAGNTHYVDHLGIPELREAVVDRYRRVYGLKTNAEKVVVTQGVSEALLMLNFAVINEGENAIIFKPYFPIYPPYLEIFGGKPIFERYDEANEWNVDTDGLERSLKRYGKSKRIKYLLVTNPNNPTGTVLSKSILEEIVGLANEHKLLLISDEVYDELVFGHAKFTSMCQLAKGMPYMILNGASKNFDATGFRVGFAMMPGEDKTSNMIMNKFRDFAQMRLCANSPGQYAMAAAMNNVSEHKKAIKSMLAEMEIRVKFATKLINESRYMHAVEPKGAFYIFPKVSFEKLRIRSDRKFVDELLREEDVQVTRGSGFGGDGHIRIVSLAPKEILETAIDRINRFCSRHAK